MQIKSPLFGSAEIAGKTRSSSFQGPAWLRGVPPLHPCCTRKDARRMCSCCRAVDEPDVAFSVTRPSARPVHLEFPLSDEEVAMLRLRTPEDAAVAVIVRKDGESPVGTGLRAISWRRWSSTPASVSACRN